MDKHKGYCPVCDAYVILGEICPDLTEEKRLEARKHLWLKHYHGDLILNDKL